MVVAERAASANPVYERALVWFRRDLRAHDHAALSLALARSRAVYCAFVFDTEILDQLGDRCDRRVEFISACIAELSETLRGLGGALCVLHGRARDEIPALAERLAVQAVYTNRDYEPVALDRDRAVQRTFVPPFLQSPKTLAMVAGHVHSYERYTRAGKTFLVTGGGGPRMRLATGRRRRHGDDCFAGPPLRGFHFLLLTLLPTGLAIAMHELQQPQQVFETLDGFTLPWAPQTMAGGP